MTLTSVWKWSENFGGVSMIFVGGFQQCPPVGDIPLYKEGRDYYMLFGSIYNFEHIKTRIIDRWQHTPASI